jgi:hypothetical protein
VATWDQFSEEIPKPFLFQPNSTNADIHASAKFLGMTPEDFLLKSGVVAKLNSMSGAENVEVPKSQTYAKDVQFNSRGVIERIGSVPFSLLRDCQNKNPLISAVVNLRVAQIRQFTQPSPDPKGESPGFVIEKKDKLSRVTHAEREEMQRLTEWVYNTGRRDFKGSEMREDLFPDYCVRLVDDLFCIDQMATELQYDRSGNPVSFFAVDGATIKKVVYGGLNGIKSDIDPRYNYFPQNNLDKKLMDARIRAIPEINDIAYVQEIVGQIVAGYTYRDLHLQISRKRTDVLKYHYGYSKTEQSVHVITAFLFALAYNMESFDNGTIPKIALNYKDKSFSTEQLQLMQDQWLANFKGLNGVWRIPILSGAVEVLDLLKNNRDMEYMDYTEFVGSLILAVFNTDSSELGLRYAQAQNVLNENQEGKQKHSRDRGLIDTLTIFEQNMESIFIKFGINKYRLRFTGIRDEDSSQKLDREGKEVKIYRTVNDIRKQNDYDPIEGGDIILDPTFLQNLQSIRQEKQMQTEQETEQAPNLDDDFNFDDLFKAEKPKVRTLI